MVNVLVDRCPWYLSWATCKVPKYGMLTAQSLLLSNIWLAVTVVQVKSNVYSHIWTIIPSIRAGKVSHSMLVEPAPRHLEPFCLFHQQPLACATTPKTLMPASISETGDISRTFGSATLCPNPPTPAFLGQKQHKPVFFFFFPPLKLLVCRAALALIVPLRWRGSDYVLISIPYTLM